MSTKTNVEAPETSNKYLEFESDDLKNEATLIKEALVASKVDLHSAFGLEQTEVKVDNTEAIKALQKIHIATAVKIEELGGEITSKQSDSETQTPAEKKVYAELEKLHSSQLSAKVTEVLKIDPDFPVDVVKEANIPTADKVSLMSAMTTVAARQVEAINRVKSEVTAQEKESEETAKFSTPTEETIAQPEEDPEAGAKYLAKIQAKFGITETETKEVEN